MSPFWILCTSLPLHETFFFPYPYWRYPASPCYDRTSRRHSRAAIGSLFPPWSAWLDRLRLNHSCHLSNHRTRLIYQMTNSNAGSAWRRPITEEKAGFVRNTGVRRGQASCFFFPPVGLSYPVRELHEVFVGHSESRGGLKPAGGREGRSASSTLLRPTCTSARSLNRRSHELWTCIIQRGSAD